MAEMLNIDESNYCRRERGQSKIIISEWEKLSKILDVPINEIFESEEQQFFVCKNNASGNYQGNNTIYYAPEFLIETQQKYIAKLEEEILQLKKELEKFKTK